MKLKPSSKRTPKMFGLPTTAKFATNNEWAGSLHFNKRTGSPVYLRIVPRGEVGDPVVLSVVSATGRDYGMRPVRSWDNHYISASAVERLCRLLEKVKKKTQRKG